MNSLIYKMAFNSEKNRLEAKYFGFLWKCQGGSFYYKVSSLKTPELFEIFSKMSLKNTLFFSACNFFRKEKKIIVSHIAVHFYCVEQASSKARETEEAVSCFKVDYSYNWSYSLQKEGKKMNNIKKMNKYFMRFMQVMKTKEAQEMFYKLPLGEFDKWVEDKIDGKNIVKFDKNKKKQEE